MPALDVHHAGHRIRAVGGGCAILQDLNALDGRFRNRIQIDEDDAPVARRIRRHAAAIEEDERRPGVEAAQGDRGRAHGGVRTVLVVGNGDAIRVRHGKIAEKFLGVALAGFVDQVARDVEDRVRSHFRRSRNGRPGHEHAFRGGFLRAVFIERPDRGCFSRRRRVLGKNAGREDERQTDCEGCSEKSEMGQSEFDHNVFSFGSRRISKMIVRSSRQLFRNLNENYFTIVTRTVSSNSSFT